MLERVQTCLKTNMLYEPGDSDGMQLCNIRVNSPLKMPSYV